MTISSWKTVLKIVLIGISILVITVIFYRLTERDIEYHNGKIKECQG